MAAATAVPSRLGLSSAVPPTPGAPLVYVAAGHGEVGLWDIATGTCLQVRDRRALAGRGACVVCILQSIICAGGRGVVVFYCCPIFFGNALEKAWRNCN